MHRWLGFGQAAPAREAGREKASRGPRRGVRGGAGKHTPLRLGLDTQTLGLWTRPPFTPKRRVSAQSRRTARVRGARALTLTRGTLRLSETVPSPGSRRPPRGGGSAAATSPRSGCRGRADALTAAGAPRARGACGQHAAAVAACGLFPPFINPAQGTEGGRG